MSAQEALQGSEMDTRELLGGTEKKSVSTRRIPCFALQANTKGFFTFGPHISCDPPATIHVNCLIKKKSDSTLHWGGKIAKG